MAALITLTSADPGNPPVTIAPTHVVTVQPRRQYKPDLASQHPGYARNVFAGAKVRVTTGEWLNVEENHDVVVGKVNSELSALKSSEVFTGSIPQSQISGLADSIVGTASDKPLKDVPAKKVSPGGTKQAPAAVAEKKPTESEAEKTVE